MPVAEVTDLTMTSIELTWPELVFNDDTGATPILSYSLEWDQGTGAFVSLLGEGAASLALTYSITSGLTTGDPYQFQVRAQNVHGWGDYSDIITAIPASPPDQPDAVTTEIDNIYVKITWTQPPTNGADIDAYTVIIASGDGLTWAEASTCDGTDPTVMSDQYCLVPMSELTDPAKFNLPYGRLIVAKVQARNSAGWSQLSDSNTDGAYSEVVPQAV